MNNAYTLDREFLFKSNIYEITSISIEQNFDVNSSYVEGEFIVSGSYRLHEISINKEDFSFKVPFKHEIRSNIDLDSISIDINNFNYELRNSDELCVKIEYVLSASESIKVFDSNESLENFLEKEDLEIVDLRDNEAAINQNTFHEEILNNYEGIPTNKEMLDDVKIIKKEESKIEENINNEMIINSINGEDEYVLYHIHTVTLNDTLESITKKYNITVNELKEYNTFDSLELNMKLIIPNEEL